MCIRDRFNNAKVFKIILFKFEREKKNTNKNKKNKKKKQKSRYEHKATFTVIMMDRDGAPFLLEFQHIQAGTSSLKLFPNQISSIKFLPLTDTVESTFFSAIIPVTAMGTLFMVYVIYRGYKIRQRR